MQLHETKPDIIEALSQDLEVIVAYKFDDAALVGRNDDDSPILVDSAEPGSGQLFDHAKLAEVEGDFIVAGGLDQDNIAELVSEVRPYGVDVSSGVCGADPRKKDATKVAAFIHSARNA